MQSIRHGNRTQNSRASVISVFELKKKLMNVKPTDTAMRQKHTHIQTNIHRQTHEETDHPHERICTHARTHTHTSVLRHAFIHTTGDDALTWLVNRSFRINEANQSAHDHVIRGMCPGHREVTERSTRWVVPNNFPPSQGHVEVKSPELVFKFTSRG